MHDCELRPLNSQDSCQQESEAPQSRQLEKKTALRVWAVFRKHTLPSLAKWGDSTPLPKKASCREGAVLSELNFPWGDAASPWQQQGGSLGN